MGPLRLKGWMDDRKEGKMEEWGDGEKKRQGGQRFGLQEDFS